MQFLNFHNDHEQRGELKLFNNGYVSVQLMQKDRQGTVAMDLKMETGYD